MNENLNYSYNDNSKKRKPLIIIVSIVIILIVATFIYFKFIKTNQNETHNTNHSQQSINNKDNIEDSTVDTNTNNSNKIVITCTPEKEYDKNGPFLMAIEDVFTITGKGTVVTGRIERGTINLNDPVQIIGLNNEIKTTTIIEIERLRENLDTATAGDSIGLLLSGIERGEVQTGQVLAKPNSISSFRKFDADIYILAKNEGGRQDPFYNNFRPQFYFRTAEITGIITLPNGVEMVMPGDNAKVTVELISPVAMEVGNEFFIREEETRIGKQTLKRTIGIGTITRIYQ